MNSNNNFDPITGQPINNQQPFQSNQPNQPINNQQLIQSQQVINNTNKIFDETIYKQPLEQNTSQKKGNKKIILIILSICMLGILFFLGYKYFFEDSVNIGQKEKLYETTSFFAMYDNSDTYKYALFNQQGQRLTDSYFTEYEPFVKNKAIVWQDDNVGVIDDQGNMIIPFKKYANIKNAGIYFEVSPIGGDRYEYSLLDENGKVLYNNNKDYHIIYMQDDYGVIDYSYPYILLQKTKEQKYVMLNGLGDELFSFPMKEGVEEPYTNYNDNFISIFYNGKNWVFDALNKNNIVSFESNNAYCFEDLSDEDDTAILKLCEGNKQYKLFKEKKVYNLPSRCSEVRAFYDNVFCNTGQEVFILDKKYEIGISTKDVIYIDSENYAKNNSQNGVDFYKNGELIKTVACHSIKEEGYAKYGYFLLKGVKSETCNNYRREIEIYNQKGELLLEDTYVDVDVVAENILLTKGNFTGYQLIDKSGNKISDIYDKLSFYEPNSINYIYATKNRLKGIINISGEEILPCEYKEIHLEERKGNEYAIIKRTDGKYIVYDLNNKKEIGIYDNNPYIYDYYFSAEENGIYKDITYNGTVIYERK